MEKYSFKGNSHTLEPGSFGIIEPGEVHSNSQNEKDSRYLVTFYLSKEQLYTSAYHIDEKINKMHFGTGSYKDMDTVRYLVKLHNILKETASALEAQSVFVEFTSQLLKKYGTETVSESKINGEELRVKRVIDMLNAHFSDDVSLNFLAENVGCTPYHLIRFFKKSVGISPYAYLMQVRLERVKQMIRAGRQLADIAYETGFADQSHLNRSFKKRYLITPGTYKKQIA